MVDYIDLAFFQSYTRTTFDATTSPTSDEVNTLISLSSQEIDELTGRTWNRVNGHVENITPNSKLVLLSKTPVLSITSVVDNNGDAVSYTIKDRDFIELDKQVDIVVTYDYGYDNIPAAIKMLTTLYTLQKVMQGGSASNDNTESIRVGPISIKSSIGLSTIVNLSSDIKKYENRVRRLII